MKDIANLNLYDGEERCAVVRADYRAFLPRIAFGVLWLLLPFFFFFPLLRMGFFGLGFGAALFVSAFVYLFSLRATWHGSALVVTTLRCIDVTRHGFRRAVVVAVPWKLVIAVHVDARTVWQKAFGLGSIRVDVADAAPFSFLLSGVKDPIRIQELFHDVQCVRSYKKAV